jgi:hypothetical protein
MAKTPKSPGGKNGPFQMPSDEELEALFGDDADLPDMTPGEMAAAAVSMLPPPVLAMLGADEKLPGLLVAIDPELSLADVDQGLDKIEDLLISMLAEVRSQRRAITSGPGSDNLDARASTIHGKDAIELLNSFLASDDDTPFLPGLDADGMKANLKALKARGR